VQGDVYRINEDRLNDESVEGRGRNILTRWQHEFDDGSALQIQGYYDYVFRGAQGDAGSFNVSTYDLELQHSLSSLGSNRIVWGIGQRISPYSIHDQIGPATSLLFRPEDRTLRLTNGFIQDQILLTQALNLTLGVKIENDPYSNTSTMPSVRLAWLPYDNTLLWTAVSRAIRSPTPFDTDVIERLGTTDFLAADQDFQREELWAYEVGYRGTITQDFSLSVSGYWNVYDDLRTVELSPAGGLPLRWGNGMEGKIYGIQAWSDLQLAAWWRISAGIATLHEDLTFKSGASGLLGTAQAGNDPHLRASLRSLMDLGHSIAFSTYLRYVGPRSDPEVESYFECNAAVTWQARSDLELYLAGANLFHPPHVEFSPGDEIPRSFRAGLKWRFQ
jgi:iron complex outermembrane receptor protein